MKSRLSLLLLLYLSAAAQTRLPESGFETLDAAMESLIGEHQIPGASIAFVRGGRLVAVRAYQWADVEARQPFLPESASRWNSMSKTVTAAGILRLVEQGRLDLEARVFDILDNIRPYNGRWGDSRIPEITVSQLLHHTGGWDRALSGDPLMPPRRDQAAAALGGPFPPSAETMARFAIAAPLDFAPGSRFAYSNFGFLLLGLVIERVSGQSYEAFVRERILDPIALTALLCAHNELEHRQPGEVRYYDAPWVPLLPSVFLPGHPLTPGPYAQLDFESVLPAGGWLGSVVHLARFAESLDGHRPPAILTADSFQRMIAPPTDRSLWVSSNSWYGLGIVGQTFPILEVWTHAGGSPGSRGNFVRFSTGCSYALLFNGEGSTGGDAFASPVNRLLSRECLDRIDWPEEDLFPKYLPPHGAAVVNAASFHAAPAAPDSLLSLFGSELEPVTLRLRDSAGAEHDLPVIYSSLAQVNFRLPPAVALGDAQLIVRRDPHPEAALALAIAAVSPGLFTPAAILRVRPDGSQVLEPATQPIRPAATLEQLYAIVYGTGIRGRTSPNAVTVLIDDNPVRPDYAGPQPTVPGLDQVNVKIAPGLVRSGEVRVSLLVDGVASNPISLVFE